MTKILKVLQSELEDYSQSKKRREDYQGFKIFSTQRACYTLKSCAVSVCINFPSHFVVFSGFITSRGELNSASPTCNQSLSVNAASLPGIAQSSYKVEHVTLCTALRKETLKDILR
jgi:hypothetical protein